MISRVFPVSEGRLISGGRKASPRGAWVVIFLQFLIVLPAVGDFIPLPPWFIYGGGNGSTWGGSSSNPDNVQLNIAMSPPPVPNQYATAVATGSSDLVQMMPGTTYTFTLAASVSGAAACEALTVDGNEVIAHTLISGLTWRRYTNSFTVGGPEDVRVGRFLNVQLLLMKGGFSYGTAAASFTNLQVQSVVERPKLTLQTLGAGQMELRWPTNFYWYVPEYATNLSIDVWQGIADLPTMQSNQFILPVSMQTGKRFFRLRQP